FAFDSSDARSADGHSTMSGRAWLCATEHFDCPGGSYFGGAATRCARLPPPPQPAMTARTARIRPGTGRGTGAGADRTTRITASRSTLPPRRRYRRRLLVVVGAGGEPGALVGVVARHGVAHAAARGDRDRVAARRADADLRRPDRARRELGVVHLDVL